MKKIPIIGLLIGAGAALFAMKKKKEADTGATAPATATTPETTTPPEETTTSG